MSEATIRSELRPGDLEAIVAHHRRVYGAEYAVDSRFGDFVAAAVARAAERGFPTERETIRIVELDGEHVGSIGLTDEGNDEAAIRWVVFSPEVRGRGLGRRLLREMLSFAEEHCYRLVWLETFSELEAAAHLYRDHGFVVTGADTAPRWGRDAITMQRYELELTDRARLSA
jgi:ribosomal protein S18 acetylase RimI-like enzyme